MSTTDTPAERLRENTVGVASVLVTGIWMAALFTGQGWWLPALLVGYVVIVPIVAMLFGDEEDMKEWWDDDDDRWGGWGWNGSENQSESDRTVEPGNTSSTTDTPLETIRRRYARGELTDAQFERKLELLLETETLEDAEDRHRARELIRERES